MPSVRGKTAWPPATWALSGAPFLSCYERLVRPLARPRGGPLLPVRLGAAASRLASRQKAVKVFPLGALFSHGRRPPPREVLAAGGHALGNDLALSCSWLSTRAASRTSLKRSSEAACSVLGAFGPWA